MSEAPYHPEAATPVEQALAERLTKAGWTQTSPDIFAFAHDNIHLELHARVGQGNLLVVLGDSEGREQEMHVEFGDQLNRVVDALVEHQSSLSLANFIPFVDDIKVVYPETVGFVDRT